jgi:5-methylcytosine-specific restriction endonuclease McrA
MEINNQDFRNDRIEYWKEVKQLIINRDINCQDCGSTVNLQVHHTTYDNEFNELEHLDDLVLLCSKCHHRYNGTKLRKGAANIFRDLYKISKYQEQDRKNLLKNK